MICWWFFRWRVFVSKKHYLSRYKNAEDTLFWNNGEHSQVQAINLCWRNEFYVEGVFIERGRNIKYIFDVENKNITQSVEQVNFDDKQETKSPDGRFDIMIQRHNIHLKFTSSNKSFVDLTYDGSENNSYSKFSNVQDAGINRTLDPDFLWREDSRYCVIQRIDQRKVRQRSLLQYSPKGNGSIPAMHYYRMPAPGDANRERAYLSIVEVSDDVTVNQNIIELPVRNAGPIEDGFVWWAADKNLYILELSACHKKCKLHTYNPYKRELREVYEECSNTFISPSPLLFQFVSLIKVLPSTNEFIWYSEKSGWGHLYLHDLTTGECIGSITAGEFAVSDILFLDEASRKIFFSAGGRETNVNPYYQFCYSVNLDGSNIQLLTSEHAHHCVPSPIANCINGIRLRPEPKLNGFSPEGTHFLDIVSRPNLPPVIVIRESQSGKQVLAKAVFDSSDSSVLQATLPITFSATAADETTDIWGLIWQPAEFDDAQSYPVILVIYGGPQSSFVPHCYGVEGNYVGGTPWSLAALGFVVVMVDPRGTPLRSKIFHDAAYRHLDSGGGLEDQVAVLNQLAQRYPWFDSENIGVAGYSGGGFAAARAMFAYPDLFKVGVAAAGNHDQRLYAGWWAETFHGAPSENNYDVLSNTDLAKNLKGKLLLVHGDLDANVHMAHTIQLVDELIQHNKDFDLLVLPNRGHIFCDDPYFIRKTWDFFTKHLLGISPPKNYAITLSEQ